MHKRECSILFLGKRNDRHVEEALAFCQSNFQEVMFYAGEWGDALPRQCERWQGDYIISYLSRWVLPEYLLKRARIAAINFHPASPNYPGIGCNNFALYEGAGEFGVTCHHMATRVDTGAIIAVKRFPIFQTDDVASLLARTYEYQLGLFYEILNLILLARCLPVSGERWTRKPFTRREFNELQRITPEMSKEEIAKRIRATSFDRWQPTIEVQGFLFEFKAGQRQRPVAAATAPNAA
jgi:methionyl-tRNA formyltransferase